MSFLSGIGDLVKQYSGGNVDAASVEQHFSQIAQSVPGSSLASGIASAIHSDQTPGFGQIAGQLFSNANGDQKASLLSGMLSSIGPEVISKFTGSNPGSPLASLLSSGQTTVTPEQASSVTPSDISSLAEKAESADPSIIERMSQIYAEHPTLVKTLGAAVMGLAVKHIAEHHSA